VLGINSDAPGFNKIRIEPNLGYLKNAEGKMPHPMGEIKVSYSINGQGKCSAVISIPKGTTGILVYNGKEYILKNGETKFEGL
jgi:alpha-L-rhamnosidase